MLFLNVFNHHIADLLVVGKVFSTNSQSGDLYREFGEFYYNCGIGSIIYQLQFLWIIWPDDRDIFAKTIEIGRDADITAPDHYWI